MQYYHNLHRSKWPALLKTLLHNLILPNYLQNYIAQIHWFVRPLQLVIQYDAPHYIEDIPVFFTVCFCVCLDKLTFADPRNARNKHLLIGNQQIVKFSELLFTAAKCFTRRRYFHSDHMIMDTSDGCGCIIKQVFLLFEGIHDHSSDKCTFIIIAFIGISFREFIFLFLRDIVIFRQQLIDRSYQNININNVGKYAFPQIFGYLSRILPIKIILFYVGRYRLPAVYPAWNELWLDGIVIVIPEDLQYHT